VGEKPMPPIGAPKRGTKIKTLNRVPDLDARPPCYSTPGLSVKGAALPTPDPQCPDTMKAGVLKRVASLTPEPDPVEIKEFSDFVGWFIPRTFVPLAPDEDVSVEHWIANAPYPDSRKRELLAKWYALTDKTAAKLRHCRCFMKKERYLTWKHARGIYSRTDEFKCMVGPIFHAIEKVVFKHPWFIKKVPIKDRPSYIRDRLYAAGSVYSNTDYTSYEASFSKKLMEACEFQLYDYMTSFLPCHDEFMEEVRKTLGGVNTCEFKYFKLMINACRMSGEMCTSLGNGFTNWMVMEYFAWKKGMEVVGVVEGDDGLCRFSGPIPDASEFAKLGLTIKLEKHTRFESASFCGLVFHPDDCLNVTDPRKALASFGWIDGMYAGSKASKQLALLRCKALSMAHQYPGCPILSVLADKALELTSGRDVRHLVKQSRAFSTYEREKLLLILPDERSLAHRRVTTPFTTRLVMDEVFGVSVDSQIAIERYISGLTLNADGTLPVLDHVLIDDLMDDVWKDYSSSYVRPKNKDPRHPVLDVSNDSYKFSFPTY